MLRFALNVVGPMGVKSLLQISKFFRLLGDVSKFAVHQPYKLL